MQERHRRRRRNAERRRCPSPRTPVLPGSVRTGEGLDTLRAHLGPGTTAVMLGPSGAGKASLLNAPEGTSETAASVGRSGGRHTTTTPACTCWPLAGPFWTPPGIRSLEGAADCLLLTTCSPTLPPSPRTAATPTAATTATWAAPARRPPAPARLPPLGRPPGASSRARSPTADAARTRRRWPTPAASGRP
ncbi:GTPase RsgA [Streptomyces sp. CB02261]|uniref:GTPase RsgA n=1 Tax=Streptomyces sp. CB02261 TaxID=1703940 RepID=UPI0009A136C4